MFTAVKDRCLVKRVAYCTRSSFELGPEFDEDVRRSGGPGDPVDPGHLVDHGDRED